ncbi:hypothetical protein [Nannocystis pusilla]|uniref:Uncharacterized protein n=1 Tax=Nannocystis pusilla TaxID=889268 RepID=A0ABS7U5C5_9BACT|nr:hypothetical protein [Nannocystis pusilla]MBZ5715747.1 hypothetical protein [Nannocystis pusilla]
MSGSIMTLIFLGVPFLFLLAFALRGVMRAAQARRFARDEQPVVPRPGPPRLQ